MTPIILIVEDDDYQYEIYEEALSKYKLLRTKTGSEALRSIPKERPDVVILDHVLDRGELGLEFLPELKELLPFVPIIVVSGALEVHQQLRALQGPRRAHYCLTKPVDIRELKRTVETALKECGEMEVVKQFEALERSHRVDAVDLFSRSSDRLSRQTSMREQLARSRQRPNISALAREFGVARRTIIRDLQELIRRGELKPEIYPEWERPAEEDETEPGSDKRDSSVLLEFDSIRVEQPDSLGQLLGSHGILVHLPTEFLFIQFELFQAFVARRFRAQPLGDRFKARLQFPKQLGADRQGVAPRQFKDFAFIAKACAHDFSRVAKGLVVGVNPLHRKHTRIFGGRKIPSGAAFVPIQDAADKRGYKRSPGLGAYDRLRKTKEQGHVTADPLPFENFRSLNALPSRGDLDEHPLARDPVARIQLDEAPRLSHQRIRVERQVCIGFRGHAPRDKPENFHPEKHEQLVHRLLELSPSARAGAATIGNGPRHHLLVRGHLRGLENQRRIRRGVLRRKGLEGGKVTGVGHHLGKTLELVELAHRAWSSHLLHLCNLAHMKSSLSVAHHRPGSSAEQLERTKCARPTRRPYSVLPKSGRQE